MSSTTRHQATAERLHSAAVHLLRAVRRVDDAMGLGPAKASALSVLVFGGPRSAGALAAAEGVKPPSLTRVIRELERDGLIRRRIDKEDRRVATQTATARAKRVLVEGRSRRAALLADRLRRLSEVDRRDLAAALPALERLAQFA